MIQARASDANFKFYALIGTTTFFFLAFCSCFIAFLFFPLKHQIDSMGLTELRVDSDPHGNFENACAGSKVLEKVYYPNSTEYHWVWTGRYNFSRTLTQYLDDYGCCGRNSPSSCDSGDCLTIHTTLQTDQNQAVSLLMNICYLLFIPEALLFLYWITKLFVDFKFTLCLFDHRVMLFYSMLIMGSFGALYLYLHQQRDENFRNFLKDYCTDEWDIFQKTAHFLSAYWFLVVVGPPIGMFMAFAGSLCPGVSYTETWIDGSGSAHNFDRYDERGDTFMYIGFGLCCCGCCFGILDFLIGTVFFWYSFTFLPYFPLVNGLLIVYHLFGYCTIRFDPEKSQSGYGLM